MYFFKYLADVLGYILASLFKNEDHLSTEEVETLPPLNNLAKYPDDAETAPPLQTPLDNSFNQANQLNKNIIKVGHIHPQDMLTQKHSTHQASQPKPMPHVELSPEPEILDFSSLFSIDDLETLSQLLEQATSHTSNQTLDTLTQKVDQTLFQNRPIEDEAELEGRVLEDTTFDFDFSKEQLQRETQTQEQPTSEGKRVDTQKLIDLFKDYVSQKSNRSLVAQTNQAQSGKVIHHNQSTSTISSNKIRSLPFYSTENQPNPEPHLNEDSQLALQNHSQLQSESNSIVFKSKSEEDDYYQVVLSIPHEQQLVGVELKKNQSTESQHLSPKVSKTTEIGLDLLIYLDKFEYKKIRK